MGNTVWVLQDGQEEDNSDHSLVLVYEKQLDKLSKEMGIKNFSKFLDYSVIATEFGGDAEVNSVEPAEVKDTYSQLITAIVDGKSKELANNSDLLDELEDCLNKVEVAQQAGKKVRLSVIP
jgi:hypothetical protein